MKHALFALLALLLCGPALGQTHQQGKVTAGDCTSWYSDQYIADLVMAPCLKVGGAVGQIQYNRDGKQLGGFNMSGDVTVNTGTGVATVVTATSSVQGKMRPDNVSCTVTAGVLTCPGSGGSASNFILPGGRLTLVSGTPIMSGNNVSTIIYYDQFNGNQVPVWNGSSFTALTIPGGEISLILDTTNFVSGNIYDIYGFNSSGLLSICGANPWGPSGGRGPTQTISQSAGITPFGIWVNANNITHCYNNSVDSGPITTDEATYLGSVWMPLSSGQLTSSIISTDTTLQISPNPCGNVHVDSVARTICFPSEPSGFSVSYYIQIDSEIMLVTGGQGTSTWSISRGQRGTTAASHSGSAAISMAPAQAICTLALRPLGYGTTTTIGFGSQCDLYNSYNKIQATMNDINATSSIPLTNFGVSNGDSFAYLQGLPDVVGTQYYQMLSSSSQIIDVTLTTANDSISNLGILTRIQPGDSGSISLQTRPQINLNVAFVIPNSPGGGSQTLTGFSTGVSLGNNPTWGYFNFQY